MLQQSVPDIHAIAILIRKSLFNGFDIISNNISHRIFANILFLAIKKNRTNPTNIIRMVPTARLSSAIVFWLKKRYTPNINYVKFQRGLSSNQNKQAP